MLEDIISEVKRSIDRSMPVIGWDLFSKQFGVIYGYDDAEQAFRASDGVRDGLLQYEQLPNRRIVSLCIINKPIEYSEDRLLERALAAIIDHAHTRDGLSWEKAQSGLRAYDAWIEAYRAGDKITNKGNALNLHRLADARSHAVAFLKSLADQMEQQSDRYASEIELLRKAAALYEQVVSSLNSLTLIYPYPISKKSADPRLKEHVLPSTQLMQQAKDAEERGIAALTELHAIISGS